MNHTPTTPPARRSPKPKGLFGSFMRSLGEVCGAIVRPIDAPSAKTPNSHAAAGDPASNATRRSHKVEEVRQTEHGPLLLRRTIIEEVEFLPGTPPANTPSDRQKGEHP
ncbi:MAG: hypothetical protein H7Y88_09435 [Phycisphaerales bacterium]|nr:hypothetical protein [Phycisphaerales bacterium]